MTQKALELAQKQRFTMQDLLELVALLRDPETGCPWDKVQTHASIRHNFIEETYEVADAIDLADPHLLCEELGDVLLQVALHTQMETEARTFAFEDVCTGICKKLIYRHPHLFGEVEADTPGEVLANWEQLKRAEKHRDSAAQDLDSVPAALPALMRAQKTVKRAAQHGLVPKGGALGQLDAALAQLHRSQPDKTAAREALGEMLLSCCALAQQLDCDAEETLGEALGGFVRRCKERESAAAPEAGRPQAD